MSRVVPVDGAALPGGVLGDVGSDAEGPAVGDEAGGVVALVSGDGAPPSAPGQALEHLQGRGSLGVAVGSGELDVDDQGVAVSMSRCPA